MAGAARFGWFSFANKAACGAVDFAGFHLSEQIAGMDWNCKEAPGL